MDNSGKSVGLALLVATSADGAGLPAPNPAPAAEALTDQIDDGSGGRGGTPASGNARRIPWRPSAAAAGVYFKDLCSDEGCTVQLVRCEAGTHIAVASDCRDLCIYVLEGELIHQGRRLWPGSAEIVAGAASEESHSDIGCVFLRVRLDPTPA